MTAKTKKQGEIRAAIYGRISTSGHGQDVGLQVDELKQVATQRGWKVVGSYIDEGISGSQESRPGLDRLFADARAGRLDLIVVWKLDRLGRSLQHLLTILDELANLNVRFISVRDPGFDDSPAGKLMISLVGAFCQFERAMIRERVQAGVDRAKAKGVSLGRPRRQFDVRAALALIAQGHGLKSMSKILNIPVTTLREHLIAAGEWPQTQGAEIPINESPQ